MNDDFVPFELAEKLKEKGFELRTRYGYIPPIKLIHEAFTDKDWTKINGYAAPTISQVLKWLREEKKIVISTFPHPCGWQADIYKDVHQYYDSEAERYSMYYHKEKTEISYSYNWLEIYCI